MITKERLEMAIPKWSSDFIASVAIRTIGVMATVVAALELLFQVAIIVPCIWLAFMAWIIWGTCKYEGGVRRCLINFFGILRKSSLWRPFPRKPAPLKSDSGIDCSRGVCFTSNYPWRKLRR